MREIHVVDLLKKKHPGTKLDIKKIQKVIMNQVFTKRGETYLGMTGLESQGEGVEAWAN